MREVQAEQATVSDRLNRLCAVLSSQVDQTAPLEKLQAAVGECLNITELTSLILNKLIDRIEIGSQDVVNGQKQQEATFVGTV